MFLTVSLLGFLPQAALPLVLFKNVAPLPRKQYLETKCHINFATILRTIFKMYHAARREFQSHEFVRLPRSFNYQFQISKDSKISVCHLSF